MNKVLFVLLTLFVMVYAYADDLDDLRTYPHPIICKPIIETETGVMVAPPEDWVIVTWAALEEITDTTLIFRNRDGVFYVPSKGFLCSQ